MWILVGTLAAAAFGAAALLFIRRLHRRRAHARTVAQLEALQRRLENEIAETLTAKDAAAVDLRNLVDDMTPSARLQYLDAVEAQRMGKVAAGE